MRPRIPKRFGPEWWACYAAAFAAEQRHMESVAGQVERHPTLGDFDRTRLMRASAAEKAVVIADDAIQGFRDAVEGDAVGDDWSEMPEDGHG